MSVNRKQKGSNVMSAEAYMGRCPIQCEQCYVNFGKSGRASVSGLEDGSGDVSEATRAFALRHGWDGSKYKIWKRPATEWYDNGPRNILTETGYVIPAVLRISCLGDSSISPAPWCRDILSLWGDHCFFNSTIRAVKQRPKNLKEIFHKVVITVNGGYQRVFDHDGRKVMYSQENVDYFYNKVIGTMDPPSSGAAIADFMHPQTFSKIGLEEHEGKVKFYRLRSLATVIPRIKTDSPVVHTMMRFHGLWGVCEFARRYGMELRVESSDGFRVAVAKKFGFDATKVKKGGTRAFVRDLSDDNTYENKSEESELVMRGGYYRASLDQVGHLKYVCDRIGKGCKGCGLCATLDGQYPGDVNPAMAEHGLLPTPFKGGYVDTMAPKAKRRRFRNPEDTVLTVSDYAGSLNEDLFAEMLGEAILCANPDEACITVEQSEEWIANTLWEVASYCMANGYYVQGWDTHEDASVLMAYCFWCMLRKSHRGGMSPEDAWTAICGFTRDVTEGVDLYRFNGDLMLMWNNEGPYIEMFGSIDEPVPVF